MLSKKFRVLLNGYGEDELLRDVYGDIIGLETEGAIQDLLDYTYYTEELVRIFSRSKPEIYTVEELKEDANKYTEGLVNYLRCASSKGYDESEVQEVVSLIHARFGEIILFNKDLVKVIEGVASEDRYEDRKQLALYTKYSNLSTGTGKNVGIKIKENATKILRENESFNSVVNKGDIMSYDDFMPILEEEYTSGYGEYTGNIRVLLPRMYDKEVYLRYLAILEEKVYSKGKEDAIKELIRMYPDKFKGVVADCVVDLGNYYLTWLGSVRIISKEGTYTGYPKKMWEISSDSKEMILSWVSYNNLYKVFM